MAPRVFTWVERAAGWPGSPRAGHTGRSRHLHQAHYRHRGVGCSWRSGEGDGGEVGDGGGCCEGEVGEGDGGGEGGGGEEGGDGP